MVSSSCASKSTEIAQDRIWEMRQRPFDSGRCRAEALLSCLVDVYGLFDDCVDYARVKQS